jgi:hypothetical protein
LADTWVTPNRSATRAIGIGSSPAPNSARVFKYISVLSLGVAGVVLVVAGVRFMAVAGGFMQTR